MANHPSHVAPTDDFLEQILSLPTFPSSDSPFPSTDSSSFAAAVSSPPPMMLQLNSSDNQPPFHSPPVYHLGLSLEQAEGGFVKPDDVSVTANRYRDDVRPKNVFRGQPMPTNVPTAPHPPAMRPRVRARRGQATDPHSIAERLRRERIAERIRALQELVPSVNKTDKAVMLDEIVDYVKFLRLQVKVLSMSRLGGAGAVAPLVTDIPLSSVEEEGNQPAWEKWSNDGTERQVAKLMEENVGAAMQFLQSKALCIMPISLASAIYQSQPSDSSSIVKPETNPPS
ncbi:hypothetical protein TanjilG_24573 [Lupinus angustifolius]|uniref:BHLH domain-containing protein n=1 Tax=Lupinus angustifolius TaxID=3871 RepID=A0A4P1RK92_LUPAN|nr:PREDICTED: transcription factor UNE12-like [Lupinus angustifolius]OIW12640.1 hypothetical protein TanjilG_24573 [Lupinus angustifolius]